MRRYTIRESVGLLAAGFALMLFGGVLSDPSQGFPHPGAVAGLVGGMVALAGAAVGIIAMKQQDDDQRHG